MNEINRQLEHDQKLRQFMNTKSQEKSLKTSNRKKKEGNFLFYNLYKLRYMIK